MVTPRFRDIVHERRFVAELAALEPNAKRADEFIRGAEFVLGRDPHEGKQVANSPVWAYPQENIKGLIPLILYYCFDENRVWFMSIQTTGFDD